jgi:pimeloyl-ACP methyl ester carboxylesterase
MTTHTDDPVVPPPDTGYATVNGVHMYYEVHGTGRPLVLLHGGLLTIDLSFGGVLPGIAATARVIAVELQGHGRTGDTDRDLTFDNLADDVVALLDALDVDRADFFGFSLGGCTALDLAIRYPSRVDRLVLASTPFRPDGYHEDVNDPARHATSTRMPSERDFLEMARTYARIAPDPGHFEALAAKASGAVAAFRGWSPDDLRAVTAPTLIVLGDNDFVTLDHAALMRGLIPDAQLAVLPGTTHNEVTRRVDLVLPLLTSFLGGSR